MDDSALTTGEAARFMGVTRQTIMAWTERGLLPCRRTGPRAHRVYDLPALRLAHRHLRRGKRNKRP